MKLSNKKEAFIVCLAGLAAVSVSLLSGCAKGDVGSKGVSGTVGLAGAPGANGTNGTQGYGAGVTLTQLALGNVMCPGGGVELENFQDLNNNGLQDLTETSIRQTFVCNGSTGLQGVAGNNGTNGSNGANGATGATGSQGSAGINTTFSVSSSSLASCPTGGVDLTLTDATHTDTEHLCNGLNGASGQAGTNGTNGANGGTVSFNLVQAIEPCGATSSPWKEVILGLQGGQLLSSFSDSASGSNTRFAFIPNGSYTDTDSSGCSFSVTGNGVSTSDISWSGGGYSWTPATGWVAHN